MTKIRWLAWAGFAVGALPLLGLTFLSPDLAAEGITGVAVVGFGLVTLTLLFLTARHHKRDFVLVVLQVVLLALVVYETLSNASLYMGT